MGNNAGSSKLLKWSSNNTKVIAICKCNSKIYSVCCRKLDKESILIASVSFSGHILLHKLVINTVSGKTNIKRISEVSNKSYTINISESLNYICSSSKVYQIIKSEKNEIIDILEHENMPSDKLYIKFIDDAYLLCSDGDIYDMNKQQIIDNNIGNNNYIEDYIDLDGIHIIVFTMNFNKICLKDISKLIMKYDDDKTYTINTNIFGKEFESDINDICFSPNGDYIAATSDDGKYVIYHRENYFNHSLNMRMIEWKLLYQKCMDYSGVSITWSDNKTVIISCDEISILYITKLSQQKPDEKFSKELINCIYDIVNDNNDDNGIKDIVNIILLYSTDIDIIDYQISPKGNNNKNNCNKKISSLSSCLFGENNQHNIVIMGGWDGWVTSIISLDQTYC